MLYSKKIFYDFYILMKISNYKNNLNFNGLHFKNVSPEVSSALKNSPVIQNLGNNYDVFISQYEKHTSGDFGKAVEYGLKYKIQEIVPNLFHKKPEFSVKGSSDFALNPALYTNRADIDKTITDDLINEAELIDENFFKSFK